MDKSIIYNSVKLFLVLLVVKLLIEPLTSTGSFNHNFNRAVDNLTSMTGLIILLGISILFGFIFTLYDKRKRK